MVSPVPLWLDAPREFRLVHSDDHSVPAHLFFDHLPFTDLKNKLLNVVIETPAGSPFEYRIDLVSGQFYTKQKYCEQNDVWMSYSGKVNKPPFSIGFVPRLLDSLGNPQRVYVFGNDKFYLKTFGKKFGEDYQKSVRVKVIGGQVLQFCHLYPCKKNQWKSQLILFAVDLEDKKYAKVNSLEDLQEIIKWKPIKAFIENGQGRSFDGMKKDHGKPAYRLIGGSNAAKALEFAFRKGHYFLFDQMGKMRKSCYSLYNYIWKSVEAIRRGGRLDKLKKKKKIHSSYYDISKRESILSGNVLGSIKPKELEAVKEKNLSFSSFLKTFSRKYGEEFYLCSKYVRSSSINNNPRRQVFMDYLTAFFHLDRIGNNFRCSTGSWSPRRRYYLKQEYKRTMVDRLMFCSTDSLNRVFSSMINYINALGKGEHKTIRYIDYDNLTDGTHHKLYSWVSSTGKKLRCSNKNDDIIRSEWQKRASFPNDFTWEKFVDVSDRRFKKNGYIR